MSDRRSSHFDDQGNARMVDVSAKPVTVRVATARGAVVMDTSTAEMIQTGAAKKGDVLGVARIAAIQATKVTSQLIPLCHAIPIESVTVDFEWAESEHGCLAESDGKSTLLCLVRVGTSGKTGVEMEAMTAAALACLTVYDMIKSVDRAVTIGPIQLIEKWGGKSGHFRRPTAG
jgi:cyclic pyranopterin phosphate synthase